jgi:hypothetical protein
MSDDRLCGLFGIPEPSLPRESSMVADDIRLGIEVEQEYSASYFEARKKELDEKQAQLNNEYAELAKLEGEAVKLSVPTKVSELEVKAKLIEEPIEGK